MTRIKNLEGDRGAKVREAALKADTKQTEARGAGLAPIIAQRPATGVKSVKGSAGAFNARGVPTAFGKGQWEIPPVHRMLERLR